MFYIVFEVRWQNIAVIPYLWFVGDLPIAMNVDMCPAKHLILSPMWDESDPSQCGRVYQSSDGFSASFA